MDGTVVYPKDWFGVKIGRKFWSILMKRVDSEFKDRVYEIVGQIPKGKIATYGQVAAMAGAAWAAWEVGQIAHLAPCASLPACSALAGQPAGLMAHQSSSVSAAPSLYLNTARSAARQKKTAAPSASYEVCPAHDLPWQRVLNKQGGLAKGYPGGYEGHKKDLEADGVEVDDDYKVRINELLWQPVQEPMSSE
jgi:alkylated DNA nucleotide flippase Atl1